MQENETQAISIDASKGDNVWLSACTADKLFQQTQLLKLLLSM